MRFGVGRRVDMKPFNRKLLIGDTLEEPYVRLFERIPYEELSIEGLHIYATAYSEAHSNLEGADRAIGYTEEVFRRISRAYSDANSAEAVHAIADARRRMAGLQEWRWQLSKDPDDLALAIKRFEEAVQSLDTVRRAGSWHHPGLVAQARIRHMLL